MIARLTTWWRKRRLDAAQDLIESYGLTVVKLQQVAGTTYIVHPDGSAHRLEHVKQAKSTVTPFQKARAA